MKDKQGQREARELLKYVSPEPVDEDWGIVVTTVGYQLVPPRQHYPVSRHPAKYNFDESGQRVLDEFQLVYIIGGSGTFSSEHVKNMYVAAGTMFLLFPGEVHSYKPNEETGWDEYWVGFRGVHIENRIRKGFFSPANCVFKIGFHADIIELYQNLIKYTGGGTKALLPVRCKRIRVDTVRDAAL